MGPVLIATDTSFTDIAAIESFDMDLAYGLDEQDFEISFESPLLTGGELLYIDGTAYGGIVDVVETQSNSTITTYRGRTWHGILSGKIIAPAYNQDYVTVSGDANACIGQIIQRVGLSGLMSVSGASSGIQITSYQFARFVNAYDGLVSMLAASGAKLVITRRDGTVELSAAPIRVIRDEVDSDVLAFTQSVNHRVPNHLVCAGEGELGERVRLDLYADAQGNVSETQTLFGVDEIAVYYDYTGADLEQLRTDGTKKLRDFQVQGNIDADVEGAGDWDVGDVLTSTDNRIGRSVTAQIVKKIVKVSMGNLSTSYEVGLPTGTASTISGSTEGGGGTAYTAGDGIAITDGTISATGVFSGAISAASAAITGVISAASATITGALSAASATITGALNAGTLTAGSADIDGGDLRLTNDAADTSASTIPEAAWWSVLMRDANGGLAAFWQTVERANGTVQSLFRARRMVNGSTVDNGVDFSIAADGTRMVSVSDAAAWRTALGLWPGSKVMTINASSFTLFTKAQLQAIVGTNWTPNGANCSVFVMNGDHGATANMMTASIDASSVVRVHMNANRNGVIRVNYLIIRFAA